MQLANRSHDHVATSVHPQTILDSHEGIWELQPRLENAPQSGEVGLVATTLQSRV